MKKFIEKLTRTENIIFGMGLLGGVLITAESFKSGFISMAIYACILSVVTLVVTQSELKKKRINS